MTENLLEFLNEIQKFAVRIKIQETINSLIKDDRVHNIINADTVIDYYEKKCMNVLIKIQKTSYFKIVNG